MNPQYDVIVVGKGNAALCAALSAQENGARVLVLEAANEDESGGNSRFAGGVMRFAYSSVDDLKRVTELTDDEIANSDFGTNTREEYLEDIYRLTSYRTDPDLSETLVNESLDVMAWLRSKGARFVKAFGTSSLKHAIQDESMVISFFFFWCVAAWASPGAHQPLWNQKRSGRGPLIAGHADGREVRPR